MGDTLSKLQPDRDLQCYFFEPSAIAALSETSAAGFTVSGCWRSQFDWAVLEWNRDNVFEYPALRNLPDGDLSGLQLSYQEVRTNCIGFDSAWYPTEPWPYLRIWADTDGGEQIYEIPLLQYATPLSSAVPATTQFQLQGAPTTGDYIELAWLDQHYNYQFLSGDSLSSAAGALAGIITANQQTGLVSATAGDSTITLTYLGVPGSNGNWIGVYGTVHGAGTESWAAASALFQGGVSPTAWQVDLNFASLTDLNGVSIPAANVTNVRKLRWTWAADMQAADFQRSEFSVVLSNWTVTGTGQQYQVAGPGSRRIENDSKTLTYTGTWVSEIGNYSGGSIQSTTAPGSAVECSYVSAFVHTLYLGTRALAGGGQVTVQVDSGTPTAISLALNGEDVLMRVSLGQQTSSVEHNVTITHSGAAGTSVYFDFLEIAVPTSNLPTFSAMPTTAAATDWDTNHSLALAPERTAWLVDTLGLRGRLNHYAGALLFYELVCQGNQYASATITFAGQPEFGGQTEIELDGTPLQHWNLIGDTAESMATCFELLINAGSTEVWAQATGASLTITSRLSGSAGNSIALSVTTNSTQFTASVTASALSGGQDGTWLTDLTVVPRMNRAARDWSSSYFKALNSYGIGVTASFSMELGNGDPSSGAAIAQRYPDGTACTVNTPALQTNFGPESTSFWQQAYLDMAQVMVSAGITPYLQFGEVQWWYMAAHGGMPFYDAHTTSAFQAAYGQPMAAIPSQNADPASYPNECVFLPALIGQFTQTIMTFVRQSAPNAKFEVLYPPDVNNTPLNRLINYPTTYWTPANLACLKTENFTYTGDRNLDLARQSIQLPEVLGFPPSQSSHLVGVSNYTTPWIREWNLARAAGMESVVLFALDQLCLIGYSLPVSTRLTRARFLSR
ncbi:MAG: hypothetical protein ABSE42_16625 [Bryobacteraceae bacterium]|jgi:hypothetical protein